jgi:small subunit ribosomal protein S6e
MVDISLNIAHPEENKSMSTSLDTEQSESLHGKMLNETFSGDLVGFDGYTFRIRGGSDRAGFPMRRDVPGIGRHKVLIKSGTGIRENRVGRRVRRTVAGNTVYEETAQLNVVVEEAGNESLFEEPEEPEDSEE